MLPFNKWAHGSFKGRSFETILGLFSSLSQIRITLHPFDRKTRFTHRSRLRLAAIFPLQNARFDLGIRPRVG